MKKYLQFLFGYSLHISAGPTRWAKHRRVEQTRLFWTRRAAEEWMSLYGPCSTIVLCRHYTPIAGRRFV